METQIRIIQVGLGPIGQKMVQYAVERVSMKIVAAVDIDPKKIGRDLGEVCNLGKTLGVTVQSPNWLKENAPQGPEVCIVTAVSVVAKLVPLLEICIKSGRHVVSTCEELAYPFDSNPQESQFIDSLAKQKKVAVLGTGINPGFLMDALPVFMTALSKNVKSVRVERHQDSRVRRVPFQQKIGAGMELVPWIKLRNQGKIKHVGFPQSLMLIANAYGWKVDRWEEMVEPVMAQEDVSSAQIKVPVGRVAGVCQTAIGYVNGEPKITLELQAYHGLKKPHDTVIIHGEPDIRSSFSGGVHGDVSTCAIVLNCVASVVNSGRAGLLTMTDIPLPHWSS